MYNPVTGSIGRRLILKYKRILITKRRIVYTSLILPSLEKQSTPSSLLPYSSFGERGTSHENTLSGPHGLVRLSVFYANISKSVVLLQQYHNVND